MANRRDEIEALRAEVRRRHKAATSKVSRLRSRGVELGDTGYDVRRDLSKIKRYNAPQLKSYLNQLESFVDRKNAFVPGDSGVPLPAAKWREYKRLEKQYNRIGNREFETISDTVPFKPGMSTPRDRRERLSKRALGAAVNSPYQEINRDSRNVTSVNALDKLTSQMRNKTSQTFLPRELSKSRRQLMDMLVEIGNSEYVDAVSDLSDHQFNVLWNYTSFATEISSDYEIMKLRARGEAERAHEKIHEDNTHAISDLLQWAGSIPDDGKVPAKKRRRRF